MGITGGWYYDADSDALYTVLSLSAMLDGPRVPNQSQTSCNDDQTSETTLLLRAWAAGDRGALERLTPRVYRTLRRIAGYQLKNERAGNSMQATALVHEAYLELIDVTNVDWAASRSFLRGLGADHAAHPA